MTTETYAVVRKAVPKQRRTNPCRKAYQPVCASRHCWHSGADLRNPEKKKRKPKKFLYFMTGYAEYGHHCPSVRTRRRKTKLPTARTPAPPVFAEPPLAKRGQGAFVPRGFVRHRREACTFSEKKDQPKRNRAAPAAGRICLPQPNNLPYFYPAPPLVSRSESKEVSPARQDRGVKFRFGFYFFGAGLCRHAAWACSAMRSSRGRKSHVFGSDSSRTVHCPSAVMQNAMPEKSGSWARRSSIALSSISRDS